MPAILTQHSYGKSRIRLTKVTRRPDRHDVRELTIEIRLEGDFASSYTLGDNRLLIATDTMKNVAYALAKEHAMESIESYGAALSGHFLEHHPHVESATVRIAEQPLERIDVGGRAHPHAFSGIGSERRTCTVRRSRAGMGVESGLDGLFLLKATGSAFSGFLRDRYTTLPDASDRIFATDLKADWLYTPGAAGAGGDPDLDLDWNGVHGLIRRMLLTTFAEHQSQSVQQTLHAMGAAAIEACPQVEQITLTMPNKHRLLVDLERFGLENLNEVFVATDEPHGTISGTLRRGSEPSP
jgi:urate oxidase